MRSLRPLLATCPVLLILGCSSGSAGPDSHAAPIDVVVEIQVAVVSGLSEGDSNDDGTWEVATDWVLPIRSSGGPGHVVCNHDGMILELSWDDVTTIDHVQRLKFDGGEWRIVNPIQRGDWTTNRLAGGKSSPPLSFGNDFDWLVSCEIDTKRPESDRRRLVVRGRLLPQNPPVQPLVLSDGNATAED